MSKRFPNQRQVTITKDKLKPPFLSLNKDTLFEASKRLDAGGLRLYIYLASNADGFTFYPSPKALERDYGMKDGQYYDAWKKLVSNGYLIQPDSNVNNFIFVERPENQDVSEQKDFDNKNDDINPDFEDERPEIRDKCPENEGRNNIKNINNITIDKPIVSNETIDIFTIKSKQQLIDYYSNRSEKDKHAIEYSIKNRYLNPNNEIPFVTDGSYFYDIGKCGVNFSDKSIVAQIANIEELCNINALRYAEINNLISNPD